MAKDSEYSGKNTGLIIQGVGALASAYGQYESDRTRNNLLRDQFNYEKQKDSRALAMTQKAQKNLDDAFSSSNLNPKKKKKKLDALGNEIVDAGSANGDFATTA